MPDELDSTPPGDEGDAKELEALLGSLQRSRGLDFTGYKRASLARRIQRRMQLVSAPTYAEYADYIDTHPDELPQLFNTVLINVTSFYRDPAAWEALAARLPALLEARESDRPIRAWCAGCASGEEPYTLAMLLCEALGRDEFARRVKIYATDIDEEALTQARLATYGPKAVEGVPPAMLEKYFARLNGSYAFSKDLRRAVIFGRHDLTRDAPISRIDILLCRNTLMYFNTETQRRIVSRLHFALNEDGVFLLGKAETLLTHESLFKPLDLKLRVFTRATRPRERIVEASLPAPAYARRDPSDPEAGNDRARARAVFEAVPMAIVVLDEQGSVALVNNHAAHTFSITTHDVGRPFQDLELSYRPVELRSYIDQARRDRRAIHVRGVERLTTSGDKSHFDVTVTPLFDQHLGLLGTQLAFADVTHYHELQADLRRAHSELETAHEELQSTSEELETTNEELQSTVEELETTNEELQSTNQELETMNEELQSTNEELQTINDELRRRGDDLNAANEFFTVVLTSLNAGVVVLDQDLVVRAWNRRMEDQWGLRTDEVVGKHFLGLDIGLPIDGLAASLRGSLAGEPEVERHVDAIDRRGKAVKCKVVISPLRSPERRGVILLVEEDA